MEMTHETTCIDGASKPWKPVRREWQAISLDSPATRRGLSFTVVSYNLLTDLCIRPGQYLYCPEHIRYMSGRHPRILTELRHMAADVICLQEVDSQYFLSRLRIDMAELGYGSTYLTREDDQGMAIFHKTDVFELLEKKHHVLHDVIRDVINDIPMKGNANEQRIQHHPDVQHVGTSGQQGCVPETVCSHASHSQLIVCAPNETSHWSRFQLECFLIQIYIFIYSYSPGGVSYTVLYYDHQMAS